jgi:PAS domain S-box-containing protein
MLAAWGAFITLGFALFRTALLETFPRIAVTSPETSASFVLLGAALMAGSSRTPMRWRWHEILAKAALLVIAFAMGRLILTEFPPAGLDAWSGVVLFPAELGRMTPVTALALGAGSVMLAFGERSRTTAFAWLMQFLLLLLVLTLLGNAGHLLNQIVGFPLFEFGVRHAALGWATAVGCVPFVVGIFFVARRMPWYGALYDNRPDRQVLALSATMLLAVASLGGLAGAVLFAQESVLAFEETLSSALAANSQLVAEAVDDAIRDVGRIARVSNLDALVRREVPQRILQRELERVFEADGGGASAIWITDAAGHALAAVGRRSAPGENRQRLGTPQAAWLFWRDGYRVEVRYPLRAGAAPLEIAAEFPLDSVSRHLNYTGALGASGEVVICANGDGTIDCYPSRLTPRAYRLPRQQYVPKRRFPVGHALAGESGVLVMSDYRSRMVVAAFAPLAGLGLGMVQKIDADELYAAIRPRFWLAMLMAGLVVLGAAIILYLRIRPTVAGLADASHRLQEAQRIAHVGDWEWDIRTNRQFWSDESFRIFGLEPGCLESSYDIFIGLVLPEDRERLGEETERSLREGTRYRCDFRIRRPDGRIRNVRGEAEVIRSEFGEPLLMRGINQDITDQVEAQAQITHLSRFYAVLSKANQAIVRIRDIDRLLEEICRIAVHEGAFVMAWAGRVVAGRVVPYAHWGKEEGYLDQSRIIIEDRALGAGPTGRAVREGRHFISHDIATDPVMEPWRALALERGYLSSAAFPVRAGDAVVGAVTFYADTPHFFSIEVVDFLNDLTEDVSFAMNAHAESERLRQAEEDLGRLNEQLEARVAERTRQLEAANRELEAFSYSVSHDLRAPLRAVDGFSQVLLNRYADKLDDTGRDYLARVRRASQRMGELIDDLLQLSRVTRGNLRRQEVDLSAMAQGMIEELRRTPPERAVAVTIQAGMQAFGDAGLLRVVLDNLLGNAWKFTRHAAAAQIEFGCRPRDGELVYCVRDNGAGFDAAYSRKLFQVFQRLHTDAEFEGTGIGLATVQRIVQRHGGRVWAEGEIGKGAAFYFTLPQRTEARAAEEAGDVAAAADAAQ